MNSRRAALDREASRSPGDNNLPAYQLIQNAIRARIESGELKPGEPIDSERKLAVAYGVSLMTARHAVQELERVGLVSRRAGVGSFVGIPKLHVSRLTSFTEAMASRGFVASSRTISAQVTEKEDDISGRLGLPHGARLIRLQRVRYGGNEPHSIETCYLPQEQCPDLLERLSDRDSLFDVLEHEYGIKLAYADEQVDVTLADSRTAKFLQVPQGAPLLRATQSLYTDEAQAIAYSVALCRSDRYLYLIRRFR
jgi:GntR family transcriptional regulator